VFVLEGTAELCALVNDSPERGIEEVIDVMVFVRLLLGFKGTGGGIARKVVLLLMLLNMVGPRRRLFTTGFGWVGVTVLLLHARDARESCLSDIGTILKPIDLHTFLDSMIAVLIWNIKQRTRMGSRTCAIFCTNP